MTTFIALNTLPHTSLAAPRDKIALYTTWLTEHASEYNTKWKWGTNDEYMGGIFVHDSSVAMLFKLTFEI